MSAIPNPRLRSATTGGFTLSLGPTAIARLVILRTELRYQAYIPAPRHNPWVWRNDMTGQKILERNGLVENIRDPDRPIVDGAGKMAPVREKYRITRAGQAAIALLIEAGVWQEYEADLPPRTAWRSDVDPNRAWLDVQRDRPSEGKAAA